jgi:phospholipid transport system substrate-binding protein
MFSRLRSLLFITVAALAAATVQAQTAPDAFVKQVSIEILDAVKADKSIQSGNVAPLRTLVESKVMPHVNFDRMTSMSVGPQWRSATPEQRKLLIVEFKTLLVNTYAGALTQVKDQTVRIKPMRSGGSETDLVVRTEVVGKGEPIELDYRLEKAADGWKIYDVNVGGFWLVEAYKGQFAKDLSSGGVDGLITRLTEKNRAASAPASKS